MVYETRSHVKRNARYKCRSVKDTNFAEATSGPMKLDQQLPVSFLEVVQKLESVLPVKSLQQLLIHF